MRLCCEPGLRRTRARQPCTSCPPRMQRFLSVIAREDSAGNAGRVFDRLSNEFGRDLLFMDVDAIPLGVDFVKFLQTEVAKCSVLLAIIGRDWLNQRDEDGQRRLDKDDDFVRVEI